MSRNPQLSARLDAYGMGVVLRADQIRVDTLDALARAWLDNPDAIADALDALAATLQRTTHPDDDTGQHPAAQDAARDALEAAAGLDPAEARLDYDTAVRLAGELHDAANQTFTARTRGAAA